MVYLVGECNPHSGAAEDALSLRYRSGRRLRAVLGVSPESYERDFERRNLCGRSWSREQAMVRAAELRREFRLSAVVLLGRRVHAAFALGAASWPAEWVAFTTFGQFAFWPHPSGINYYRYWSSADSVHRARLALVSLVPFVRLGTVP